MPPDIRNADELDRFFCAESKDLIVSASDHVASTHLNEEDERKARNLLDKLSAAFNECDLCPAHQLVIAASVFCSIKERTLQGMLMLQLTELMDKVKEDGHDESPN